MRFERANNIFNFCAVGISLRGEIPEGRASLFFLSWVLAAIFLVEMTSGTTSWEGESVSGVFTLSETFLFRGFLGLF